jgi:hypothetical protein
MELRESEKNGAYKGIISSLARFVVYQSSSDGLFRIKEIDEYASLGATIHFVRYS